MIEILIFILPTFFALVVNDKINTKEKNLYDIIKNFGGYCCLINLVMMIILFIYIPNDFDITEHIKRLNFIFKYFLLATILAVILPITVEFIKKNVNINLIFKEVKHEKGN